MMNKNVVHVTIENCIDCKQHEIISDPDPDDWFCVDDVAVVCTMVPNPKRDTNSKWVAERNEFRLITVGCRPYNIRKESKIPNWCPLLREDKS